MKYVIAFAFIFLAMGYAYWVIRQAKVSRCPSCARDGEDSALWPVLFNLLWWCPNCGEMQQSRLMQAAVGAATSETTVRQRLGGLRHRGESTDESAPSMAAPESEDDPPAPPRFGS